MITTLGPNNNPQDYLVRVANGSSLKMMPITKLPDIKNYVLLETCERRRYSKTTKTYTPVGVRGTLSRKHDEVTQEIRVFTARNLEELFKKIEDFILNKKKEA